MKYRRLLVVPMAALLFLLSACAGKAKPISTDDMPRRIISADWPMYETAQKLVERGSFVLVGTVTDISYQVVDIDTGEAPTEKSEKLDCMLHTIYDIKVIKSYKGNARDTVRACREGGDEGVRVEAQLKALGEDAVNGIPVVEGWTTDIEVGKSYLFVLSQYEDRMPRILNPYQGVHELTETEEDEYKTLPSLKDIVTYFGAEQWDELQKLLSEARK